MIDSAAVDNTEVSGKTRISLEAPVSSPLLEDSPKQRLFAEYFRSTWIEDNASSERRLPVDVLTSTSSEQLATELDARFGALEATELSTPSYTDRMIRRPSRSIRSYEQPQSEVDPIAKVAGERVQLLARKYVAKEKYSDEERARLAIVTERVRKLLPAVTVHEFEALERVLTSLRDITKENASLREKLRLAVQKDA